MAKIIRTESTTTAKIKDFPNDPPVFIECGCCGSYHHRNLPGLIDCRDDAHRFTADDLDALYGAAHWEEIGIEDQERQMEDLD